MTNGMVRYIVKFSILFLIIMNANILAEISWSEILFFNKRVFSSELAKPERNKFNIKHDLNRSKKVLIDKSLFGAVKSIANESEPSVIGKSRLNITVTGIVYSDVSENNILIIERNGKQSSYAIGDTIEGTAAVIRHVEPQRVIIERAGNFESLMLEQTVHVNTSLSSINTSKNTVVQKTDQLLDYISIAPVNEAGYLQGYRVNPGKNPDLFNKSGLNPNDLAVAVNGYDLRNNAQAAQFMASVPQQTQFTLSVVRNAVEQEIVIDLNRL